MTKADLVERVTAQISRTAGPMISKKDCARVVDAFLDSIKEALQGQKNIEVRGFGTFKIRHRKTRMARNPRTGSPVEVSARPVPVFKPSKELRAMVAGLELDDFEDEEENDGGVSTSPSRLRAARRKIGVEPLSSLRVKLREGSELRRIIKTMTVTVLLFASYADALGQRQIPLELPQGSTVAEAVRRVRAMAGAVQLPPEPIVAVNEEYARADRALSSGDELAIIPPVAGG